MAVRSGPCRITDLVLRSSDAHIWSVTHFQFHTYALATHCFFLLSRIYLPSLNYRQPSCTAHAPERHYAHASCYKVLLYTPIGCQTSSLRRNAIWRTGTRTHSGASQRSMETSDYVTGSGGGETIRWWGGQQLTGRTWVENILQTLKQHRRILALCKRCMTHLFQNEICSLFFFISHWGQNRINFVIFKQFVISFY